MFESEEEGTFRMWGYEFYGAYTTPDPLASVPGVFVVWCEGPGSWKVVDVGESNDVRASVLGSKNLDCWSKGCRRGLRYSALYTPSMELSERISIERRIRAISNPPCGDFNRAGE
jgi:hypothetical protein